MPTYKLHDYQEAGVDFMYEDDHGLILCPLGAGKTIMALRYMYEMIRDGFAKRFLVVAPKRVCETVWRQEAEKWGLPLRIVFCAGTPRQRLQIIEQGDYDVMLINYELLIWFCREVGKNHPFDGILFDELTKMKTPGSQRFRLLRNLVSTFKYRWGMTGTLAAEGVETMYGQLYMIDLGHRLGKNKEAFEAEFMQRYGSMSWEIRPRPDAVAKITSLLADITFSLSGDYAPPKLVETPVYLDLPDDVREIYDELERDLVTALHNGERISTPNTGALRNKLRQIATGEMYTDIHTDSTMALHTVKLDWIQENRDQMPGNILIGYWFRFEPCGPTATTEAIDRWNAGELSEMWIQPASAGHGLNLQAGGHTVVMKTLPESRDMYDQLIGRLRRQGQESDTVWVYVPIMRNTIEEDVWRALTLKADVDMSVMDGLKRRWATGDADTTPDINRPWPGLGVAG